MSKEGTAQTAPKDLPRFVPVFLRSAGLRSAGQQLPASQYADDTEAFLEGGSIAATCQRVGAFLAAMRTFASASGQHLNPTKTKLLPIGASPPFLPPTIHGLEVVHTAEGLGITLNSGTQPPSADWQALLQKVEASYTKLSCLGLSAFGRGFGSTAYGTSKLLFHAEYAGPLPPACAAQLDSWTARLVDGGRAPSNRQRGFTGVKGELLAAPPACGGFGTLPWQEHISARHAGWGLRLVMAGQPAQQRNPPPAAASASQQTGPAAAIQAEQTTPMPPWAAVARQLLRNIHPSFKPSHLLTLPAGHHWAAQLPAPLRRMHLGLRMLPAPELTAPPPAPGPWCCATPIWGNPLLELLDGRTLADAFPLVAAIYPDARIRCLEMAFAAANSPLQLFNPYLHPLRQQLAALLSLIPVPWRQAAWDHGQAGASLDQQAGLRPILPLVGWQLEGSSSAVALPRYSVRHGTRLQQLQPGQPGQPSAHLQRLQRLAAFAALAVAPPPRAPVQLQPTPQPPTQPPPASLTAAQAEAAPVLRLLARLWKLKWHNSHKEVARAAAPRPRNLLVLCSKAPREEPSLHPRLQRFLEADTQLASMVKENPRLLQSLEPPTEVLYISMISQARSYSEVAALLQSAISQGATTVKSSCAALVRLRSLYTRNKHGRHEQMKAASELALRDLLRRLPDADLRSLATLARAAYQLGIPVKQEEQQRILSKFISLVTGLQARQAAKAKPGPPPPKPGWVQIKLSKQGPSAAAVGTAAAAERAYGSSSSSSSAWTAVSGLVRRAAISGEAAVKRYIDEGGMADILLNRVLSQLSSDALMSIGLLQLRCAPGTLAALFGQALADLESKPPKPVNAVDGRGHLHSIAVVFQGLAYVSYLSPEECRVALNLPAARDLAWEFASRVKGPQDYELWIRMLTACCLLGFNPPVGSQHDSLRVNLLKRFRAMNQEFSLPRSLDLLFVLGLVYGLPSRGGLAADLEPYRKNLVDVARGCQKVSLGTMLVRSTVRPWHGGSRVGLLPLTSAAPRPRNSLVLCSKAPREDPFLHPSVRRFLEADPQLASLAKENPRLLQSLEPPAEVLCTLRISQARSYSEVAVLLRSAISQDAATVVTSGAALDRLRTLNARNKRGNREQLRAAGELALRDMLRRLPDADLRSLATLARAAYQLGLPVPQEEQQRILSKFVSLVTALQERQTARAKPGLPPPKPGWVQVTHSRQGPSAAAGVVAERKGSSTTSSSTGSGQPLVAQPGMVELSGPAHREFELSGAAHREEQSISNFVWAILSNGKWQLPDEQLAALMDISMLQLRFAPGTLAALFGQGLADLAGKSECRAALQLPAARDLALEFAGRVEGPQDYEPWVRMLTACCLMGFNPPGDGQQASLLVYLLK
ncbi:hypothetical protein N2152v2_010028 [Parachlorella kessleri]